MRSGNSRIAYQKYDNEYKNLRKKTAPVFIYKE